MSEPIRMILFGLAIASHPIALHAQSGHDHLPARAEITPAHVYQKVGMLRSELELIRLEMGKPASSLPPITVKNANPREVFFQAATLFRKANRLAFEHTREQIEEPKEPDDGQIEPADVFPVVIAAIERVGKVKESLAIKEACTLPPLDPSVTPSRVYNSILIANRAINQLLDHRFTPGDVYQQVTVGIAYLSRLLDSPGETSTPPEPPPFQRRKRPSDVYQAILESIADVREVGKAAEYEMLELSIDEGRIGEMDPSDVYDLSTLLVSELAYLHDKRSGAKPPRRVYNPGRKLPAHVFQRAGVLQKQIQMLQDRVSANPDWLK